MGRGGGAAQLPLAGHEWSFPFEYRLVQYPVQLRWRRSFWQKTVTRQVHNSTVNASCVILDTLQSLTYLSRFETWGSPETTAGSQ